MATTTPLQSPGIPSIILPAYTAPEFTTPTVPFNTAVTSVEFEDVQGVTPVTFGQVFKQGQLTVHDGIVGRMQGIPDFQLQVDVKNTHKDGSLRYAIISAIVPQNGKMFLVRAAKPSYVNMLSAECTVSVTILEAGVEYSAVNSTQGVQWLSGNVADENIQSVPLRTALGVEHPHLTVQFATRRYADGKAKVDVIVEHTKAYTAINDITYDIKVSVNSQEVYTKLAQAHFPCTRYRMTFWSTAKPTIHVKHNTAYLLATKAVPNYDQSVVMEESKLNEYAKFLTTHKFGPMDFGIFQPYMGTTGGRSDIGLAPAWYAATILSMDKRAKNLMLESANVAGSWSIHRRHTDGTMLDVIRFPRATLAGTPMDSINPLTKLPEKLPALITKSLSQPDTSHQPAFAYIPYILTGDYYYLEELKFWCHFNTYYGNPYYRNFEKALFRTDQVRGQAWSLRTMAQAEYIVPDDDVHKTAYKYWLDCNMEYYRINYTDGSYTSVKTPLSDIKSIPVDPYFYNDLGICLNGPVIAYPIKEIAGRGIAPWMDDFITQAVGYVAELGHKEAARFLKWKAKFQVGRMIAEGYCPTDACTYALAVRDSGATDTLTKVSPAIYKTLAECWNKTIGGICNPASDMTGYPTSPEGYPANYQPALAMASQSGIDGGEKAWQLFHSRKLKPNYGLAPQFAIVPRKDEDVVIVTPPVTEPPVVGVPPVVVMPSVKISNPALKDKTQLTVIMKNGPTTRIYINQLGNEGGEVTIVDNFIPQVKYECEVIDSLGYTIAKIYPIQTV